MLCRMSVQSQDVYATAGVPLSVIGSGGSGNVGGINVSTMIITPTSDNYISSGIFITGTNITEQFSPYITFSNANSSTTSRIAAANSVTNPLIVIRNRAAAANPVLYGGAVWQTGRSYSAATLTTSPLDNGIYICNQYISPSIVDPSLDTVYWTSFGGSVDGASISNTTSHSALTINATGDLVWRPSTMTGNTNNISLVTDNGTANNITISAQGTLNLNSGAITTVNNGDAIYITVANQGYDPNAFNMQFFSTVWTGSADTAGYIPGSVVKTGSLTALNSTFVCIQRGTSALAPDVDTAHWARL